MKYLLSVIVVISLTGCAVTWSTVGAFIAGGVAVAEDVMEVHKLYKELKSDTNVTKE